MTRSDWIKAGVAVPVMFLFVGIVLFGLGAAASLLSWGFDGSGWYNYWGWWR